MSFCTFSKDFSANGYTLVENQFITKYLPHSDGDAVKAYLYGLYLCQCADEFDAVTAAKLLGMTAEKLADIFTFWEDCDLVRVLSKDPLFVQYLPVNSAIGRPKPIRAEKYAQFNREFYKILQTAQKAFRPYEMQRILEFLENNQMEQQAFLLVAEYCAKKDGEKLTSQHILNKAEKLCREHKFTFEQVESELSDFHSHEKEMARVFTLLGIYRKPVENDYDYLNKWLSLGLDAQSIYDCAGALKRGNLSTLDSLIAEVTEHDAHTQTEIKEYLERRAELVEIVFALGQKLGLKIQNPRPYAEEYVEKWLSLGYDGESLSALGGLGLKLGFGFAELDHLLSELYAQGIVDEKGVEEYVGMRNKEFKLLQKIQSVCGVTKKSQATLDMVRTWQTLWNFSDKMILEAAKRSANASAPLPYMNKLLSEWKRAGVDSPEKIPDFSPAPAPQQKPKSKETITADRRSEREHYYSVLQSRAVANAKKARGIAESDEEFKRAESALKKGEIELARAEVYAPDTLPAIKAELETQKNRRKQALLRLNLTEEDLLPRFVCKKCSDTGFLPDGRMCDCYKEE